MNINSINRKNEANHIIIENKQIIIIKLKEIIASIRKETIISTKKAILHKQNKHPQTDNPTKTTLNNPSKELTPCLNTNRKYISLESGVLKYRKSSNVLDPRFC